MKNLRKLVIASFMLVIAFVAVVSSTYAWFTGNAVATVSDISIEVVDAKYAILISKDGYAQAPTWGKTVEFSFDGKMTPTTLLDDATTPANRAFKTLDIANSTSLTVKYNDAGILLENGQDSDTGYIQFDLWFQVDAANDENLGSKNIVLDVTGLKAQTFDAEANNGQGEWTDNDNELAISSFRLAAASIIGASAANETIGAILTHVVQGTREVDSNVTGDVVGTYGAGRQFALTNNWMSIYKNSNNVLDGGTEQSPKGFVKYDNATTPTKYQLEHVDATSNAAVNIIDGSQVNQHEIVIPLVTALNGAVEVTDETRGFAHIRVYVWMEGWDGDCINAAAACRYVFGLSFQVE